MHAHMHTTECSVVIKVAMHVCISVANLLVAEMSVLTTCTVISVDDGLLSCKSIVKFSEFSLELYVGRPKSTKTTT